MRRTIKLLLAAVAILSVMCAGSAFAAANKKIMWGVSGISGYDAASNSCDYMYYGTWNGQPVKWRVLAASGGNSTTDERATFSDGTNSVEAGRAMFLLSEKLLAQNIHFDNSRSPLNNEWQGSDAQAWCEKFPNKFLPAESAAILKTTKTDISYSSPYSSFKEAANILSGDKVFFLSAKEAGTDAYGFIDNDARLAYYDTNASVWWLRSPYDHFDPHLAGAVRADGNVIDDNVNNSWAARPAFNLDLNSVLFTSAAAGGKSGGAAASENFFKNADNSSNEWKVTLLDSSRSGFKAEAAGQTGDTLTISYSGAKTGQNEYISAIIKDSSDNISHYGRRGTAADNAQGNTVTLTLPQGFNASDDTLYIFNEQYNGDHKTDYASELKTIELYTVTAVHDSNGTADANPKNAVKDTEITLSATPITPGYVFDKWEVVKPTTGLTITGDKFTMPDEPVEVKATFKRSSTPPSTPDQTPSYTTGKYNGAIDRDRSDTLWDSRVGGDMTIYINVDLAKFDNAVSLDGVLLTQDTASVSHDFGVREGSTVVTIWEKTLKEHITTDGEHTAEVGFKDGTAIHSFTVRGTGETPPQKQSTSGGACASGVFAPLVAMIGLAAMAIRKRNR